jgi:hypothetical protein
MSRRILLTATFAALLLATTPALASQQTGAVQASQSRLAALTQSYFATLNHALATSSFAGLRALFAPRATLIEQSALTLTAPSAYISTVRGQSAIVQFYRHLSTDLGGSRWIVGVMNQVSPTTMVAYARIVAAQSIPTLSSMQRLTIRNGKIARVDLTLYSVK